MKTFTPFLILLLLTLPLTDSESQTREDGPWWPHPIWGAEDQAGGSNWITPQKILESLELVTTGKVYEIGQVYERDMPLYGQRTYSMFIPGSPTGGPFGDNKLVYHDDLLVTEIGQVGTQFDGPGHIGKRLEMEDGTEKDVFYNGYTLDEMKHPYGLLKLGIENIKPIITRGILIDIAGFKEVEVLDANYEVTLEDVKRALEKQGIAETSIKPGDALLFRYGWSKYWKEPEKYNSRAPGIGMEVAQWVIEKQPSMVGSDQYTTEVDPSHNPNLANPIHQELITKNGIWNLENMVYDPLVADGVYEFLFIFTPTRFKGATGSPGRPIAIK